MKKGEQKMKDHYWWDYFTEELTDEKDPYSPPERYGKIVGSESGFYSAFYRSVFDVSKSITFNYTKEDTKACDYETLLSLFLEKQGMMRGDIRERPFLVMIPIKELKKMVKVYGLES